jgi:AraC-like DNA-binding protein
MCAKDQSAFTRFLKKCEPLICSGGDRTNDSFLRDCCELVEQIPSVSDPIMQWQLSGVLIRLLCEVAFRIGILPRDGSLFMLATSSAYDDVSRAFFRIFCALTETKSLGQSQVVHSRVSSDRDGGPKAMSALKYILENSAHSDMRLFDVARHVRLSRGHIDRLLVRYTGAGFTKHLRDARLTHARTLLLNTEMSVKEIAFAVGYKYANELNRHFRMVFGSTPTSWRRHARFCGTAMAVHE